MWLDPITNHVATDPFNVADWTRIHDNAAEVAALFDALSITYTPLTVLVAPDITTIPVVEDINSLFGNVEILRAVSGLTLTPIEDEYVAGMEEISPDYVAFNWVETCLLALYNWATALLALS
jgi:hypothetical protein